MLISRFLFHHYRNQQLCRVPGTLGKAPKTPGEGFAECSTRRSALGKQILGKDIFAECFLSHTRRKLCRVLYLTLGEDFQKKIKKSTMLSGHHHVTAVAATTTLPPPPAPSLDRRRHTCRRGCCAGRLRAPCSVCCAPSPWPLRRSSVRYRTTGETAGRGVPCALRRRRHRRKVAGPRAPPPPEKGGRAPRASAAGGRGPGPARRR